MISKYIPILLQNNFKYTIGYNANYIDISPNNNLTYGYTDNLNRNVKSGSNSWLFTKEEIEISRKKNINNEVEKFMENGS